MILIIKCALQGKRIGSCLKPLIGVIAKVQRLTIGILDASEVTSRVKSALNGLRWRTHYFAGAGRLDKLIECAIGHDAFAGKVLHIGEIVVSIVGERDLLDIVVENLRKPMEGVIGIAGN